MNREPTEMELRVLAEISEFHSGDSKEGMKIVRAAIRAMRDPTTEMLREAGMVVAGNTEAHAAGWETIIDAASPQEE
jgi:hypothetical protein